MGIRVGFRGHLLGAERSRICWIGIRVNRINWVGIGVRVRIDRFCVGRIKVLDNARTIFLLRPLGRSDQAIIDEPIIPER